METSQLEDVRPALAKTLAAQPNYDVFLDLSETGLSRQQLEAYLEALDGDAGLGGAAGRVTAVIPVDTVSPASMPNLTTIAAKGVTPSDALHRAIRAAAAHNRNLVVMLDSILPANEVISRLIQEFERDPLFGTTQPRFADARTDLIWCLPGNRSDETSAPFPRASLSLLPEILITPELLAACIVIRHEVVSEMEHSNSGLTSAAGELRFLLCQARRRGFRNLVVNRAVLSTQTRYSRVYPSPPESELIRLRSTYTDIVRADTTASDLPQRKLETILAGAYIDDFRRMPRLLLDCRGMISMHNGTSHGILGLLDGLHARDYSWQIEAVASSAVIEFFKLRKRYPKFGWNADHPQGAYMAAVLLNQPWALSTIAELHQHALLIAFNMLDTISWDILYVCDERLEAVWRFVARYSDALFYDSEFTRDRFDVRFPVQVHVAERVAYLSLARDEQVEHDVLGEPEGEHILLFGNDYDHKDVRRTLQLLVDGFPYARVVAIGIEGTSLRNVVTMPSGGIEHTVLHRLLATARVVVFPSFYEGFGLPVVQGLAYGRTVVVRRSPLWQEIAAQVRMPGQLVQFDSAASLVEAVGRALSGGPLDALPQGSALSAGQSSLRWKDCSQRIIDTLEKLLPSADGRRWLEREEALRAIELLHS